ncbi:MAG: hypothetical protein JJT76_06800 [Clostridiaceae bacterium]|nr:hypothetical protein [Clostridiaceae bacterium]
MEDHESNQEKEITKKFQKHETNTIILTILVIFVAPLLLGGLFFAGHHGFISDRFIHIVLMLCVIAMVFVSTSRKCPNCGAFMDRYKVFPKDCHKCGVKLK